MKKLVKVLLVLSVLLALVGCQKQEDDKTIKVVCTPEPHGIILEKAKELLSEKGYDLEIITVDDYDIPNRSVSEGEADANYFQHVPYFNLQVEKYGYDLVNVAGIHIEPFGFYSQVINDVSELKQNDTIVISDSVSDYGRILAILEKAGLITFKEGTDVLTATLDSIAENKLNLQFVPIDDEMLFQAYKNNEGTLVAINGNYAITNGLNPVKDAIILEQKDANNPYVNILCSRSDNQNSDKILALKEVLTSAEMKEFIETTYSDGSVIAVE